MTQQHDAPEGGKNHDLYKTEDVGAPDTIKDRNGEVVLGLCKRCGKAEVELSEPCVAPTPPAPSGLVDAARAMRKALEEIVKLNREREWMGDGPDGGWIVRDGQYARIARATLDDALSVQQGGAGLRPEGTRLGLEAAIKIVVDEMETVSSLSSSYERLQAILVGLHGELRRAKSHD